MPTNPLLRRNAPLHTEYLPADALAPMPGAPRMHPKSQIRALTKSFDTFGQVLPILIDGENRIISGHAQWEVAKRLGLADVMAIRVEHLSEPQIKALMVALNRLGDLSKWDEQALGTILLDLHALDLDFDIEATGFAKIEIELMPLDLDVAGRATPYSRGSIKSPMIGSSSSSSVCMRMT
jgi:ParB-like chromosome segregation protein Spo0J